jgi:hypothetical protein
LFKFTILDKKKKKKIIILSSNNLHFSQYYIFHIFYYVFNIYKREAVYKNKLEVLRIIVEAKLVKTRRDLLPATYAGWPRN